MRISDWSSDVCSSDLVDDLEAAARRAHTPLNAYRCATGAFLDARLHEDVFLGGRHRLENLDRLAGITAKAGRLGLQHPFAEQVLIFQLQIGRASSRERVCKYV